MTGKDVTFNLVVAEGNLEAALNNVMAYGTLKAERHPMATYIRAALEQVRRELELRSVEEREERS